MGKRESVKLWVLLLVLVLLDVVGILATLNKLRLPTGDPSAPYLSLHLNPRGYLTVERIGPDGRRGSPTHVWPYVLGALTIWWPVPTVLGLGLLALVLTKTRARHRRTSERSEWPRFTMSRGMVVIAAASVWLWLSRTAMFWILCGTLVLLLALVADSRRTRLAQELKSKGTQASPWLRVGIAGYWVAVILVLSWIVCLLVSDSLLPGALFTHDPTIWLN